jgi:hypothetical protein
MSRSYTSSPPKRLHGVYGTAYIYIYIYIFFYFKLYDLLTVSVTVNFHFIALHFSSGRQRLLTTAAVS